MHDIDYGGPKLVFLDTDRRPYTLRFRIDIEASVSAGHTTGQLIATITNTRRHDHGHTQDISRPAVAFDDIERALTGWLIWARTSSTTADLAKIRHRIAESGLT
ncbi:hypothetical protein [Mycolicibacterium mageritense]|uniref:hypothetical protein n=1 Tax=Mycolicibacterium mageritense TaxID=53462 RepID=UPI001E589FEC|nr:hypothetical protein [Mycolicibacterium mageritense]MCC9186700.1 hypothetical protein [Mycolicibacterium mageritense]